MSKFICALVICVAAATCVAAADRYGIPAGGSGTPSDVGPPPRDSSAATGGPSLLSNGSTDDGYNVLPSDSARGNVAQPVGGGSGNVSAPPPSAPRSAAPPTGGQSSSTAPPPGYGARSDAATTGAPPSGSETGMKPSSMMRAMLTPPTGSRLTGQPVKLDEVVAGATSRMDQSQRIEAYWDLCSSVADYYLGVREQDELQRLRGMTQQAGAAWQQAQSELGVRIGTSLKAAIASQYRLASMMGRVDSGFLPLPADIPHCGDYYTRYDQVFANRSSIEARQLSELLPLRYQELKDASIAVTRAEEWLDAVASQRGSASDGTGSLRALELMALRRRAFVQIVRDYNRRIARYAELSSPGQIDAGRLISMLVKRDNAPSTSSRSSAPPAPSNRQSQDESNGQQQTFVEEWTPARGGVASGATRDDAVKPSSAESDPKPHVEHSLLVPSD